MLAEFVTIYTCLSIVVGYCYVAEKFDNRKTIRKYGARRVGNIRRHIEI